METLAAMIPLLVLIVPISVLVRLIAALFSERVRHSIALRPVAHLIWFLGGVAVVILILLLPPLRHPGLKKGTSFKTPSHAFPPSALSPQPFLTIPNRPASGVSRTSDIDQQWKRV
jgi:hypothetical protein